MYGHNAEDSMCLGTVCIDTYPFYYATAQTWWDFRLDDDGENSQNYIGGICGLGKERPGEEGTRSFLARAEAEGFVADNVYAINMSPHKYGKSYLTLGGFYPYDYKGQLYWYDVKEKYEDWRLNVPHIKLGDSEFYPSDESSNFKGHFQTGYPYIGLPEETFEQIKFHFMRSYSGLECKDRNTWGICYIENAECGWYQHVDLSFTLQIEDHFFTMPMRNLMDDITIQGKKYCRLLIANDKYGTPKTIKIGDAFFKGFNTIFDVN